MTYTPRSQSLSMLAAGIFIAGLASAHGQTSNDALIDALVKKGILTSEEAKQFRQQDAKSTTTTSGSKLQFNEWVNGVKFSGDFRGRFEENDTDNSAYTARDRYRYRLRLGATMSLQEHFDVGVRLA